jgi:hypothetical protein
MLLILLPPRPSTIPLDHPQQRSYPAVDVFFFGIRVHPSPAAYEKVYLSIVFLSHLPRRHSCGSISSFRNFPTQKPCGQSPQQVSNGERVVERREPRHRGGDRHPRRSRLGRRRHPGPRRSSAHPTSPRTPPTISQAP